jgi:phosphatidylethanolamine/phosphatidyl-N-methylethanolamine N-methyltransferase
VVADVSGFLLRFLRDPESTGAIAPATRALALKVALATHEAYSRHVAGGKIDEPELALIELGAGTGALTRTIELLNPILVEQDEAWASLLKKNFPSLEVRVECATQTLRALVRPVGVVTSIPFFNNPQGRDIKRLLAKGYAGGLIKFCVLYTYGWSNPLAGVGFSEARRRCFVVRSFPPASVWVYQ